MATITDNDLKMFKERARTELASGCDTGGIAWDSVIWDLCNEVRRLRSVSKESGDAAKLRKALVQAELFVGNIVRHGHQTLVPGDKCTACDGAEELRDMICAALSAPSRNCDRTECATLEMATKTWIREEFGPHCNNSKATMGDIRTFDVWIYATATEKEGGDK